MYLKELDEWQTLFYEIFIDITLVHRLEGEGLQHLL